MDTLERAIAAVSLWTARIAIPLMVVLGAWLIFARHLRIGLDADAKEAVGLAFFLLLMGSFGYAYLRDAHVRVDSASRHFSARVRAAIELAGCVAVLLPICAVLIGYGSDARGARSSRPSGSRERSSAPVAGAPRGAGGRAVAARGGVLRLRALRPHAAPLTMQGTHGLALAMLAALACAPLQRAAGRRRADRRRTCIRRSGHPVRRAARDRPSARSTSASTAR
jgi:TRAP-type mannitol/chloroaromatic compound transport system permease small subunit